MALEKLSFLLAVRLYHGPYLNFSFVLQSWIVYCLLSTWSLPSNLFNRHFDKDKTGYLDHQEFKSCLRSLGYDLSIVEEGEEDPEFQSILRTVDPNG